MRQYPISEIFWDPEENFEILNLKKTPKIDYLAMQRLMEIFISVKKHLKL